MTPTTELPDEPRCQAGCKRFYGGEVRHHKDCHYYTESLSQMYDKADAEIARLKDMIGASACTVTKSDVPFCDFHKDEEIARLRAAVRDLAAFLNECEIDPMLLTEHADTIRECME